MFPQLDQAELRTRLLQLGESIVGQIPMRLSYPPLVYTAGQFYRVPMGHHGNIARIDAEGIHLRMGQNDDPHRRDLAPALPAIPTTQQSQGFGVGQGGSLLVPISGVVDFWLDEAGERKTNLWLRHLVVYNGDWILLPILTPAEVTARFTR